MSGRIAIVGAGIAGLTAALALSRRGFAVDLIERAPQLEEAGAGLQLSPNACRILGRLGVLDRLQHTACRPDAVVLRDAGSLQKLARVPLGATAEKRWSAPYLVAHRADLQAALLETVMDDGNIRFLTGCTLTGIEMGEEDVLLQTQAAGETAQDASIRSWLLVGADGIWSQTRVHIPGGGVQRHAGLIAWRTTLPAARLAQLAVLKEKNVVTAFLHPHGHLVAYPMRGGTSFNLVVFTPAPDASRTDPAPLQATLAQMAPELGRLADAETWTAWPLYTVDPLARWTDGQRIALIGDAAHAMTPFAAQGAAMAIEDAAVLAVLLDTFIEEPARALERYEALRRPRVLAVARQSAINRLTWHAAGPVAIGRNLLLRLVSPEVLTARLDWLYGHDAERAAIAA
jgi:salicylate hydroxylase